MPLIKNSQRDLAHKLSNTRLEEVEKQKIKPKVS